MSDDITVDKLRSNIKKMDEKDKKNSQALLSKMRVDISKSDPSLTSTKVRGFELEGKTYQVDSHRDVLLKVAEIALHKHWDEQDKILLICGRKRKYFSKDTKDLFHDYRRINGTNIYAELNENAKTLQKRCEQILLAYGVDIFSFKILSYR